MAYSDLGAQIAEVFADAQCLAPAPDPVAFAARHGLRADGGGLLTEERRAILRRFTRENPHSGRAASRRWRKRHPEESRAGVRRWRQRNKARRNAADRARRARRAGRVA